MIGAHRHTIGKHVDSRVLSRLMMNSVIQVVEPTCYGLLSRFLQNIDAVHNRVPASRPTPRRGWRHHGEDTCQDHEDLSANHCSFRRIWWGAILLAGRGGGVRVVLVFTEL